MAKAKKTRAEWNHIFEKAKDVVLPYTATEMPELGNSTPESLIDDLGYVKHAMKQFEKAEEILKGRIDALLEGKKDWKGDVYEQKFKTSERTALNQGKAKEVLGSLVPPRLQECLSTMEVSARYVEERDH